MSESARLHAFHPDADGGNSAADSAGTFRCDRATFRQVVDWWRYNPAREYASNVAEVERQKIWSLACDHLGSRLVVDCRPFHLMAFINAQELVKKNNTRRRWSATIQRPFNEAELLGLIVKNPFRGLRFPKGSEGRDWTDDEFTAVIKAANQRFGELILGLRLSGFRPDEACSLCWTQIRFEIGDIKIDDHKMRHRTKAPRIVPLNEPLVELFQAIRARQHPGPRVFRTAKGKPWTREYADTAFRRLRESIGLAADLKLHGCRHTFGTAAIMNNVEVMKVMSMMGHTDIRTTQRYVHLSDKSGHLVPDMNQAVKGVKSKKQQDQTPLFDGLE